MNLQKPSSHKTNARIISAAVLCALIAAVMALALSGCGNREPIVGTWESDSGYLHEYYEDGTHSFTNKHFTELGALYGTWEVYEETPTIEAGVRHGASTKCAIFRLTNSIESNGQTGTLSS